MAIGLVLGSSPLLFIRFLSYHHDTTRVLKIIPKKPTYFPLHAITTVDLVNEEYPYSSGCA